MHDAGIDFTPSTKPLALAPAPASPDQPLPDIAIGGGGDMRVWPFPVQFSPVEGAERSLAEHCEILQTGETALSGTLLSFEPGANRLSLLRARTGAVEDVDAAVAAAAEAAASGWTGAAQ